MQVLNSIIASMSYVMLFCIPGKAHLRASLLMHEEALRLHRMCRQLRQIDNLQERLRTAHDASLDRYARCEQEDDFQEILDAPPIQAATKYQLTLTIPEFSEYTVDDLFHELNLVFILQLNV
ncbi:UNVERIFIED_CONTAM: Rhophilin-2 [Trichonephila clavipes]